MVVISTSICNKNGKIIFARQYQPISRIELEEIVIQFTRNVDSTQSTIVEHEKTRYIYIPIDNLYLIVITPIKSNVVEYIELLKLIYRLLQDQCGGNINETNIKQNAYELALGIDDIVSFGFREEINISQIKQLLQMESQAEKEFKKEQLEKELQAKKQMDEKMKELEKMKRENKLNQNSSVSR